MNYRDTPCERCGWKFPGFHVCVDTSTPVDPQIQMKHNKGAGMISAAHLERLQLGRESRWHRHREETMERDKNIVERYKEGDISLKELSRDTGLAFQTVRNIVQRAVERGEVEMRARGQNVRQA